MDAISTRVFRCVGIRSCLSMTCYHQSLADTIVPTSTTKLCEHARRFIAQLRDPNFATSFFDNREYVGEIFVVMPLLCGRGDQPINAPHIIGELGLYNKITDGCDVAAGDYDDVFGVGCVLTARALRATIVHPACYALSEPRDIESLMPWLSCKFTTNDQLDNVRRLKSLHSVIFGMLARGHAARAAEVAALVLNCFMMQHPGVYTDEQQQPLDFARAHLRDLAKDYILPHALSRMFGVMRCDDTSITDPSPTIPTGVVSRSQRAKPTVDAHTRVVEQTPQALAAYAAELNTTNSCVCGVRWLRMPIAHSGTLMVCALSVLGNYPEDGCAITFDQSNTTV